MSDIDDLGPTPSEQVRRISQKASEVDVDNKVPIKRYLRSLNEMIKFALIYEKEGDWCSAFILHNKYLTLSVEKLKNHLEYKTLKKEDLAVLKKQINLSLVSAEVSKKKLLEYYEVQYKQRKVEYEIHQKELESRQIEEQKKLEEEEKRRNIYEKEQELEKFKKFKDAEKFKIESPKNVISIQPIEPESSSVFETDLKPSVDRSLKPSSINSYQQQLRCIQLPSDLVPKFVQHAQENSEKKIEFCAFICGKLDRSSFHASHLIIPKQSGTSDSCSAINEDQVWEVCSSQDLFQIGWIHTHPTQTAFLSSVDLHTTGPIQQMLPEYIAIVWSGKTNSAKFLSLTDSGLSIIRQCKQTGFHEHPGSYPLFDECSHIKHNDRATTTVIDLRKII